MTSSSLNHRQNANNKAFYLSPSAQDDVNKRLGRSAFPQDDFFEQMRTSSVLSLLTFTLGKLTPPAGALRT